MKNYSRVVIFLLFLCCLNSIWATQPSPTRPANTIKIEISGLPKEPLKNIYIRLNEKQAALKNDYTAKKIMDFYHSIPREIKEGIKPYGYFKPSILSSDIKHPQPSLWIIHFTVDPGYRFSFTKIDLQITGEGVSDPAFKQLSQNFTIKAGDSFDSAKYEESKNDLFLLATSRGFFKAKMIKSQIKINLETHYVTATIIFDTGPRFRFGPTHSSKTPFSDLFIRRFLRYQTGEYFSQEKIKQTYENFSNSNYFSTVFITPQFKKAKDLYIPIDIQLNTQPKKQYNFGLGYSTDTRLRASLNTNYHWINSYGHSFNTYLRASAVNSSLLANYYIPGKNPATDQYNFAVALLNQNQFKGKGISGRLSVGYQTYLNNWQQTISLTALKERFKMMGPPITATVIYPSILWQQIRTNNLLNPKRGHSISATVSGGLVSTQAEKPEISFPTMSFFRVRLDSRFLFTVGDNTRFLIRNSLGYTAIEDIKALPLSLRFQAGGAQSLRGFEYNSIGPDNPGRTLMVSSFEIQRKIIENLYLTAFIDVGNVSNNLFEEKLKIGTGPGLALLTPIGMLELSFAKPISEPNKSWAVQFSMGSPI